MRGRYIERRWMFDPALHAPVRYRRACRYDAFLPDPLADTHLEIGGELAGLISEAEASIAALNRTTSGALAPLARLLLRTESIASSKVEGLQADTRGIARGEVATDTGRSVGPDVAAVIANIDAMEFAIASASSTRAIRRRMILDIHRVLMERRTPGSAGRLRTTQGWIGGNDYNPCGADYVPPPDDSVATLVDDLCRFASDDGLPPLVQAALAHAQFETIHPFDDGNGRTGRTLIHVILRRRGIAPVFVPPMSVVMAAKKQRYIDGLVAYREDDLDRWLEVFATAAIRSTSLAERYLARVAELQERWRDRVRSRLALRADAAAWRLIDILPGHPVITVAVASAALTAQDTPRSRTAIQGAVPQLMSVGVIQPVSTSKRNRAWEAGDLLDLIERLEAST